jgi:hypothetical protein
MKPTSNRAATGCAPAREAAPRRGSPWDITMPAELDSPRPSQPFEEPLRGMAIREVIEPHVFSHFFGKPAL